MCNIKKYIRLNKNWPKSEINYSFWNVFPLYIFLQRIFETCFPFFFLSTGRSFQELLPSYLILLLISFFNFFSLIARFEIYIFFSFLFLPSYIFRYFRCSIDNVARRIEKHIDSFVEKFQEPIISGSMDVLHVARSICNFVRETAYVLPLTFPCKSSINFPPRESFFYSILYSCCFLFIQTVLRII